MDEIITDFEELIDLNTSLLFVSQRSSQGPISDVLDKMCEAMGESNLETHNIFENNDTTNKTINVLNGNNVDQTPFRITSVTECFGTDSIEYNEIDDGKAATSTTKHEQSNKTGKTIANDDMDEFESILAAKCLGNNYNEPNYDITKHNEKHMKNVIDEILAYEDIIDLKEFEGLGFGFSNNNSIEYANIETDIGNTSSSNQYELPTTKVSNVYADEFQRFLATKCLAESNVEKKNKRMDNITTTSKARNLNENEAYLNENVIDLDEFMSQDTEDSNQAENYCNITTVALNEIPLECEVDNKHTIETVTEPTHHTILNNDICINSDSEDGFNSSDFEFISEDEASKAGITTKSKTIVENSNNISVNNNLKMSNIRITELTHHEIVNNDICINSDSEDGFNSSDFEFISQDEASKAGITTKSKTIVENSNNISVNNNLKMSNIIITELTHHKIVNNDICINYDSENGFNSSNFEFISEDEASKAGITTKSKTIDENSNNGSVNNNLKMSNTSMSENDIVIFNARKNEASLSDYKKYSKYRFQRCYSYPENSENHTIPEGEQYLDMFRGPNAPEIMDNLLMMSSKRVMPPVLMAVSREDSIFRLFEVDESCEEHERDAKESINKILATYPRENRRNRRRH